MKSTMLLILGFIGYVAVNAAEETTTTVPDEMETTTLMDFITEEPVPSSENLTSLASDTNEVNEVVPVQPTTEREQIIAKLCGEVKNYTVPEHIQKYYPYYLSGFDYDERPIWVAELGKYDLRSIVEAGPESIETFDKFVKLATCRMMSSHTMKNEYGHDIDFILDFDGLQLSQLASLPTMSYLLKLATSYRKIIEGYTHYIFVLNANYVTEALANLVRPIFGRILEITDIHGSNKQKWLPELLKRFPKDQIPEWYGGQKGYTPLQIYGR